MRQILIASLALALAACASSAEVINANSEGITFTLEDSTSALERATKKAQKHCEGFGRVAVMQSTDKVEKRDRIANFSCVSAQQ